VENILVELAKFGPVALICGVLLWVNADHQRQMARRLMLLETELLEVVKNNTAALELLRDRPCMVTRERHG
jgi:hypothetical protein